MRNSSGGKFQYKCHDDSNDQKSVVSYGLIVIVLSCAIVALLLPRAQTFCIRRAGQLLWVLSANVCVYGIDDLCGVM